MFTVVITEKGGAQRRMEFDKNEVTIGRVQGNDIILPKGNVSKRHSRIVLKDNRFIVVDLKSTNGTYVNGRKITSPLVVKPGDKIYIGDFIMTVEESGADAQAGQQPEAPQPSFDQPPPSQPAPSSSPPAPRRSAATPPPLRSSQPSASAAHAAPPPPAYEEAPPSAAPEPDRFPLDEEPSGEMPPPRVSPPRSRKRTVQESQPPDLGAHPANAPQTLAPPPRGDSGPHHPPVSHRPSGPGVVVPDRPGLEGALRAVVGRVSQVMDVHNTDPGALHDQGRWGAAQQMVENAISQLQGEGLLGDQDAVDLAGVAVREIVGLGALEGLLSDDSVREIMVEGPRRIVADFGQGLTRVPGVFSSADAVVTVARRLLAQSGGHFTPNRHIQHGTLPYGPHVTAILPPIAVRGPIIEIRRMAGGLDAGGLVGRGVLSEEILEVVRDAVSARRNVAVLGPVGAGVTTVLGALAGLVGDGARIVTAEDVPDLAIASDNVISLGTGGADSGVRLRDVVRQAGALRADHLVVDDVRGTDAIDVFAELAARSGGDFVGVHGHGAAGDTLMGIARIGTMSSDAALASLLARAVQVVLEVSRDEEGNHRVLRVTEITGANGKGLVTKDLFVYDGDFQATGVAPSFRV